MYSDGREHLPRSPLTAGARVTAIPPDKKFGYTHLQIRRALPHRFPITRPAVTTKNSRKRKSGSSSKVSTLRDPRALRRRRSAATRQIVRDWVLRRNEGGPDGLINRKAPACRCCS